MGSLIVTSSPFFLKSCSMLCCVPDQFCFLNIKKYSGSVYVFLRGKYFLLLGSQT
jgi:hypothetical protein